MTSRNKQVVLHPIAFALYPVCFLYSGNKELFDISTTLAPAAICVAVAGVLWCLSRPFLSSWSRAAVVTSALLMATFSYSAVVRSVSSLAEGQESDFWSKLVGGCLLAVVVAVVYALRSVENLGKANYVLNVVSLLLVAAPLFQVALWTAGAASYASELPDRTEFNRDTLPTQAVGGPDIYYFVLDGYAREDVLRATYEFDNSGMIESLRELGFTVPNKAVANYPFTLVSVNSSLNFSYLQDLFGSGLASADDHRYLRDLMEDSRIVRLLKSANYRIVTYESEYWGANIGNVDTNLKEWWFPSLFSVGILQMTPVPDLLEAAGYSVLYDMHRIRTEYPFEHIQDAIDLPGPKFVYAHTFFAHPPFVFGPNGERVSYSTDYSWDDGARPLEDASSARETYNDGYRAQITYLNKRVVEAVRQILSHSEREPIIIMHGDHGPDARYDYESLENTDLAERYSIFYAAHLPDGGGEKIYESLSPVNGLRIVLNEYFDANYELLEDHSFFAPQSRPYDYQPIPGIPSPVVADDPPMEVDRPGKPQPTKAAPTTPGDD